VFDGAAPFDSTASICTGSIGTASIDMTLMI
jgi:hypothetical protein